MKHLTDQSLIDYRFDLLEADLAAEVARHLAACEQCQRRSSELAKKLEALDLLKQEPAMTEDLVRQTLDSVRRTRPVTHIRAWWAAAAAVVLAATAIMSWMQWGTVQRPASTVPVAMDKAKQGLVPSDAPASLQPTANNEERITSNDLEPPPFAPASAIELVTLPRRESVQLTIYNSVDLTLVRDRRSLTLKKGWNWLQFMWANTLIDPTSLDLEPQGHEDAIRVEQLVFPAGLKDIGRWLIRSDVEGQVLFEITYFTSGISWRAFYEGILSTDTRSLQLKGYVRVTNNSGEDYENAQVRLIVGQVHLLDQIAELAKRQYPYGSPILESGRKNYLYSMKDETKDSLLLFDKAGLSNAPLQTLKEITKEGLSEYFLYTIEGTETIPNGWSKRLVSMEANDVPVVNLFKYERERYGDAVVRFLTFKNDEEHKLGETPIPDGEVKVYRAVDDTGHMSYVGSTGFKYIPVGQEVELNLGEVRDVMVEPTLMDYKTEQHQFDNNRDVSGWDEVRTFKVQVRNSYAIPVQVEIKQDLPTTYWDLTRADAIGTYEQVDADTFKFTLDLTAGFRQSFEYQLRTYHGTREQDWRK
jgi:hypothetical protein